MTHAIRGLLLSVLWVLALIPRSIAEELPLQEQVDLLWQQCIEKHRQGLYAQARSDCQQVVDVLESSGSVPSLLAAAQNNLAELFRTQGDYAKAETLYLRSLRLLEKTLGPQHLDVASCLNNLAALYQTQGNLTKAEPLYLRSLQIREKELGPDHARVATSLNNLAELYHVQGAHTQAEPLYVRSLRIREKELGPNHPDVASSINNLAALYKAQSRYDKAEPLFLRGLRIWERALGGEHPDVALSLNNLAQLYRAKGKYEKAEPLYLRSLRIWEKALGADHPTLAESQNNLADLYVCTAQIDRALPRFQRVLEIREQNLRAAATETRITALLETMRFEEDIAYSLPLIKDAPPDTRSLALRVSLLRKGRAQEAGRMTGWALQASLNTEEQRQRFASWQGLRAQREKLLLQGPTHQTDATRKAYQAQLAALNSQVDDGENELARAAPQLTEWKLPTPEQIVSQVATRMTVGSVLVDVLWISPYRFLATGTEKRWEPPRYIALLLFPDRRIEFVDLGDADGVDHATAELLGALRTPNREPVRPARALFQRVMAPILSRLNGIKKIYLSPDGSLNLIPFAALHDGKRYLLDAPYQIQYLSSGRDLLQRSMAQPEQPALVMADPAFGTKLAEAQPGGARAVDETVRGLYDGLSGLAQLQGARAEGAMVGGLLRTPPLFGAEATEARLRQVRSPWLLHIATHGLLVSSTQGGNPGSRALVPNQPSAAMESDVATQDLPGRTGIRPWSGSALVLAGSAHAANARDSTNDGLLTAEEARSLSLFGTQLVVLSACETGRGTASAGQGVYGLRRAFMVAGAETLVTSLWCPGPA